MNLFDDSDHRRIVPRWRDFSLTVGKAELLPLDILKPHDFLQVGLEFEEKKKDWEQEKGIVFASDLIGAAVALGRDKDAIEAARYILKRPNEVPHAVLNLADSLIRRTNSVVEQDLSKEVTEPQDKSRLRIRQLRARINADPRNAIAHVDVARIYANLGLKKQAKTSIDRALLLAPNSRFVVRSAARFMVHIHEPERALSIVRNHERLAQDPWLLSAEIALSSVAGRGSRVAKRARKLVDDRHFSESQVTELASALASIELEHGDRRQSKKLFGLSLEVPTDNAVAQAEWASRTNHIELIEPKHLEVARAFEARAFEAFNDADLKRTYNYSLVWLLDEPFSSRPVDLASFVASVGLEEYKLAVDICRAGIAANVSNQGVRNSLIYSLAMAGDLQGANQEFELIDLASANTVEKICLLATGGLLAYRGGNALQGREAYTNAIRAAQAARLTEMATRAKIFWAREEARLNTPEAKSIYQSAADEAKKLPKSTANELVKKILGKIVADGLNSK